MKTILLLTIAAPAFAANWPGWRGPHGTGVANESNLPLTWSATENVRWRAELPERGNSSPIVWGEKVFVTQALSDSKRRTLMCFDRSNGKLLWQSGPTFEGREQTQRDNPYCSATPVTDGERVIASFGSAGLYCYDLSGKELWKRDLGKMEHMFGNAASPVLVDDLCVLNFGPDEKARLVAVNKRSGEIAWETQPPKVEIDQPRGGFGGGGARGSDRDRGTRPAEDRTARERQAGADPAESGDRPSGERGSPRPEGDGGASRRGGGGFGPGQWLAPQIVTQADKNADQKVSSEEFSALATNWFDKIDTKQTGKVDQQAFTERFGEVFPPRPEAANDDNQDGNRRRGFGRGGAAGFARFMAPGLFTATDTNKDTSLVREEWTGTFAKWFTDWNKQKTGALDEAIIRDGLNASLPRPQFGGGPGGGRGFGGGPGGGGSSWSTPVLVTSDGREELVISLPGCLAAFDPKTGKQLWISKGLGGTIYTSPVVGENTLVAMTSGPGGGNAIAVKPGGNGDVTESQRVWRKERMKSAIGSGVIHEGHLYSIGQDGIAACLNLKDGNTVWEERLKGPSSRGSSWSSMILADGRIYVPNQSGDVFVLRAAPKFEILATNTVKEPTNASFAVADGEIFMRTDKALWCIAAPKTTSAPETK